MSEHTAKQWLQNTMLSNLEQYSLKSFSGPTKPTDLTAFLDKAKTGLAGTIKADTNSTLDAQYKFMGANKVYNPGESNALFTRKVAEFFCLLFRTIRDKADHKLTKYDLWHGHFVHTDSMGMVVIFHAKEQPSDIQTDGVDNSQSPFASTDACFNGRNVLWVSGPNKCYVLDTGDSSDIYKKYIEERVSDYDEFLKPMFTQTRTVWETDLGTPRGFVYYKVNTSSFSWKSTHISIAPQSL